MQESFVVVIVCGSVVLLITSFKKILQKIDTARKNKYFEELVRKQRNF